MLVGLNTRTRVDRRQAEPPNPHPKNVDDIQTPIKPYDNPKALWLLSPKP